MKNQARKQEVLWLRLARNAPRGRQDPFGRALPRFLGARSPSDSRVRREAVHSHAEESLEDSPLGSWDKKL